MGPLRALATLVLATALAAPIAASAQQPSASPVQGASPSPAASPGPVDCAPTVARLPSSFEGSPIAVTITQGVAAIDPDELLDPLLTALGRGRDDVCVVEFRFGEGSDALGGQLLRIAGVDATGSIDVAGRFALSLRDRLVGYGAEATASSIDIGGQPVWSLQVTATGQRTDILVHQLGDALLVMSGAADMGRLLPLIVEATPATQATPATTPTPAPSTALPRPSVKTSTPEP